MKKLKDPEPGLARFLPLVELLGEKLGPILFQLPPFWDYDEDRLASFLAVLPREHHYAFELRNPTWHNQRVYELLRRYNAALCIFDLAGFQSPLELTADFTYLRLHGPGGKYQGSYTASALRAWGRRLRDWQDQLRAIYVYFDNDQAGYAARNALDLRAFLQASERHA